MSFAFLNFAFLNYNLYVIKGRIQLWVRLAWAHGMATNYPSLHFMHFIKIVIDLCIAVYSNWIIP